MDHHQSNYTSIVHHIPATPLTVSFQTIKRIALALFCLCLLLPLAIPELSAQDTLPTPTVAATPVPLPRPPGGFHFGPRVSLGLPTPIQVGIEGYWNPSLRFSVSQGFLLLPMRSGSLVFGTASLDLGVRFFPIGNWLHLGAALGYRRLQVSADISSIKVDGEKIANRLIATLHTFQLNPTIGIAWPFAQGWELSADVGAQIPIFFDGTLAVEDSTNTVERVPIGAVNPLSRIAGLFLPQVTLVRLTWYWR